MGAVVIILLLFAVVIIGATIWYLLAPDAPLPTPADDAKAELKRKTLACVAEQRMRGVSSPILACNQLCKGTYRTNDVEASYCDDILPLDSNYRGDAPPPWDVCVDQKRASGLALAQSINACRNACEAAGDNNKLNECKPYCCDRWFQVPVDVERNDAEAKFKTCVHDQMSRGQYSLGLQDATRACNQMCRTEGINDIPPRGMCDRMFPI
jgi:hypothetical protein